MSTCSVRIWGLLLLLLSNAEWLYGQKAHPKQDTIFTAAHTDFLYFQGGHFAQDIYLTAQRDASAAISIASYRYTGGRDSIQVYRHQSTCKIKKGTSKIVLPFQGATSIYYILPAFAAVIRKTDLIPPGSYKVLLRIEAEGTLYEREFIQEKDSMLAVTSGIRQGINDVINPLAGRLFPGNRPVAPALDKAGRVMEKSQYRLQRYFKKKGLQPQQYHKEDKEIIDVYADNWFMGRYELNSNASLQEELKKQQSGLQDNLGSFTSNYLGDYPSLLSQFRELKKNSKENKDLVGEISLAANFSNDQEQFSGQDNTYYEGRGMLEFPLFDIPVSVAGYYTTQDKHRQAKASYIHFRYDAEKAKEQLLKLVGSYNKRYEQTIAQGANYNMIYGQLVQQLQTEKDQAVAGLKQQVDLKGMDIASLSEEQLKEAALRKLEAGKDKLKDKARDSLTKMALHSDAAGTLNEQAEALQRNKQKAEDTYAKALEQYRKVQALEAKIRRYQALLEQYKNTAYYDSLMAYSKVKDLKNMDQASYKDLAKKASGLLPESKTKGLITGLTNFDAGMFPKYVSDYTQSGQMLKGVDVGYDIGFATIGGSYGKTEYIDRDGQVEGYKAYGGRVAFKPILQQQVGLVYYGYSPGKKLLYDDNFFKDASISLPSFRNPVHILSATYSGAISQYLNVTGEYAFSNKPGQSEEAKAQVSFKDRSAYNLKLEGTIPATNIDVEAGYEHAGRSFENNTLPVIMAGTERFKIGGKGDFFRSFLTLGVEYNYLIQNSLNAKGNNSRWGFSLATHSKRYPSVSVAYKPFSTFRSFTDTLNIAQKPIQGEVWTGKINYQIKKQNRALRFTLLYNRNNSTMDTVNYSSSLLQFNTVYTYKTTMLSLNLGSSRINTDYITVAYPAFNNSQFGNIAAGGLVLQTVQLSGGTDIATTSMGISRYGFFLGSGYTFKKMPVMIRANFRYSNYRLSELAGWKEVYSAGIELAWRFKLKLFDY